MYWSKSVKCDSDGKRDNDTKRKQSFSRSSQWWKQNSGLHLDNTEWILEELLVQWLEFFPAILTILNIPRLTNALIIPKSPAPAPEFLAIR